ncbi:hypothetical protein [Isachenkonia alkalipeptolytica]|uniref:Uncharacterized protein n=1 Tax=Isachenkonia alkalipeptolytica TaxID=2565777 RepID=A0AA43XKR5_9CLOT|nr:hypothetical protein [Isachenkonia alkalipeptolytica]NBG88638.1 hypothetical protein [Isachenkonia alkalipeptolytica]
MNKSTFKGTIISIQPRIRLTRSFDEASHTYLGYAITLKGELVNTKSTFSIGIEKAAQAKHEFKVNDVISEACVPVPDPDMEPAEFHKVSKLKLLSKGTTGSTSSPWELVPPALEVYRQRGHRRLAARTYDTKCISCMWGARMPVEIIIDNWNPRGKKKYRFETFCYGPLNCKLYKAGPKRKVEVRNKMVYIEEDWVDEMAVEHRDPEECSW